MIPWLETPHFPPLERALAQPSGLLAAGGELSPEWLLTAYARGIFPWFNEGDPILWWSPNPRMIVVPNEICISRSLRKTLRRRSFEIRCNTAFAQVIAACAAPREPGGGTWITGEMQKAYCRMNQLGHAHSVEAWQEGKLAGGLYGMAIGRVFFGESMFHHITDASKVAFAHLAYYLEKMQFAMIDCQMNTAHLATLGGREIPRQEFAAALTQWTPLAPPQRCWQPDCMQDIQWD